VISGEGSKIPRIEPNLEIEIERRRIFLEFAKKAFSGADVEETFLPQINRPDR
jgi:hypothetical protein